MRLILLLVLTFGEEIEAKRRFNKVQNVKRPKETQPDRIRNEKPRKEIHGLEIKDEIEKKIDKEKIRSPVMDAFQGLIWWAACSLIPGYIIYITLTAVELEMGSYWCSSSSCEAVGGMMGVVIDSNTKEWPTSALILLVWSITIFVPFYTFFTSIVKYYDEMNWMNDKGLDQLGDSWDSKKASNKRPKEHIRAQSIFMWSMTLFAVLEISNPSFVLAYVAKIFLIGFICMWTIYWCFGQKQIRILYFTWVLLIGHLLHTAACSPERKGLYQFFAFLVYLLGWTMLRSKSFEKYGFPERKQGGRPSFLAVFDFLFNDKFTTRKEVLKESAKDGNIVSVPFYGFVNWSCKVIIEKILSPWFIMQQFDAGMAIAFFFSSGTYLTYRMVDYDILENTTFISNGQQNPLREQIPSWITNAKQFCAALIAMGLLFLAAYILFDLVPKQNAMDLLVMTMPFGLIIFVAGFASCPTSSSRELWNTIGWLSIFLVLFGGPGYSLWSGEYHRGWLFAFFKEDEVKKEKPTKTSLPSRKEYKELVHRLAKSLDAKEKLQLLADPPKLTAKIEKFYANQKLQNAKMDHKNKKDDKK